MLDGAPIALRYAANRQSMSATGIPYRDRDGQFLLFDPRGDGLIAQVFGDPSTADRFAVIAWLGYDAPDGIDLSAAAEDPAQTGAAALERFVAGLTTVRPHATIDLVGYSYGSTVIGVAAHRPTRPAGALPPLGMAGGAVPVLLGYPASAVGVPGEKWSNRDPPGAGRPWHRLVRLPVFGLMLAGLTRLFRRFE